VKSYNQWFTRFKGETKPAAPAVVARAFRSGRIRRPVYAARHGQNVHLNGQPAAPIPRHS